MVWKRYAIALIRKASPDRADHVLERIEKAFGNLSEYLQGGNCPKKLSDIGKYRGVFFKLCWMIESHVCVMVMDGAICRHCWNDACFRGVCAVCNILKHQQLSGARNFLYSGAENCESAAPGPRFPQISPQGPPPGRSALRRTAAPGKKPGGTPRIALPAAKPATL